MNQNSGKTKGNYITYIVIFGLVSILLVGFGIGNLIKHRDYFFGDAKDFNELVKEGWTPKKGEYVQIGVNVCFDWYAETTQKTNGITTSKQKHCLVYVDDGKNGAFVSLTVKGKKNFQMIDEIIDSTWDYLHDETETIQLHTPVVFEGKIKSIGSKVDGYYDETVDYYSDNMFYAWGYLPECYEITIDTTDNKRSTLFYYIIGSLIVAMFIYIVISSAKNLKAMKTAEKAGYDSNAFMQNRQNSFDETESGKIYGNDIVGYSNVPENDYINDIVSGNRKDDDGGFKL